MMGYRRAAAALHGMHKEDREWILAGLDSGDRAAVTTFLDELDSLGFSRDVALDGRDLIAAGAHPSPSDPMTEIRCATAARMLEVLEAEPSSLIAQLMSIGDWPWAGELLDGMGDARRERVRHALADMRQPAPARRDMLVNEVAGRLRDAREAGDGGARNMRNGIFSPAGAAWSRVADWILPWKK